MFELGFLGIAALFSLIGLAGTVFWIWAIIDCAANESSRDNTKIVWILVIVFLHWIGALAYFIARRPQRIAELGR